MIKFLTATAALALAASAVHADPGGGKGGSKGNQDKGGHSDHAMQGGGGGGGGQDKGAARAKGNAGGGKPDRVMAQVERGNSGKGKSDEARGDRGNDRRSFDRNDDRGRDDVRVIRDDRVVVRDGRRDNRDDGRDRFHWDDFGGRGLVDGCPPGLAKKNNGCMPPGLARDRARDAYWDRPDWWGMDGLGDGRFAYYGGNLVRLNDRGGVLGYLPLLGGALSPGNAWPSYYQPVELPGYYQDYYGLGSSNNYRYYDDAIYGVDPQTQAITSIVALLTGDDFNVGQPMPLGYDVYNVPYSYRDQYVDGPDSLYRYSDGYVYQVDPKTQLISAAIELLT